MSTIDKFTQNRFVYICTFVSIWCILGLIACDNPDPSPVPVATVKNIPLTVSPPPEPSASPATSNDSQISEGTDDSEEDADAIRIGRRPGIRQEIFAHILSFMLEEIGIESEVQQSDIDPWEALSNDEIDIYWEYTGYALMTDDFLNFTNVQQNIQSLSPASFVWLSAPTPFNEKLTLFVQKESLSEWLDHNHFEMIVNQSISIFDDKPPTYGFAEIALKLSTQNIYVSVCIPEELDYLFNDESNSHMRFGEFLRAYELSPNFFRLRPKSNPIAEALENNDCDIVIDSIAAVETNGQPDEDSKNNLDNHLIQFKDDFQFFPLNNRADIIMSEALHEELIDYDVLADFECVSTVLDIQMVQGISSYIKNQGTGFQKVSDDVIEEALSVYIFDSRPWEEHWETCMLAKTAIATFAEDSQQHTLSKLTLDLWSSVDESVRLLESEDSELEDIGIIAHWKYVQTALREIEDLSFLPPADEAWERLRNTSDDNHQWVLRTQFDNQTIAIIHQESFEANFDVAVPSSLFEVLGLLESTDLTFTICVDEAYFEDEDSIHFGNLPSITSDDETILDDIEIEYVSSNLFAQLRGEGPIQCDLVLSFPSIFALENSDGMSILNDDLGIFDSGNDLALFVQKKSSATINHRLIDDLICIIESLDDDDFTEIFNMTSDTLNPERLSSIISDCKPPSPICENVLHNGEFENPSSWSLERAERERNNSIKNRRADMLRLGPRKDVSIDRELHHTAKQIIEKGQMEGAVSATLSFYFYPSQQNLYGDDRQMIWIEEWADTSWKTVDKGKFQLPITAQNQWLPYSIDLAEYRDKKIRLVFQVVNCFNDSCKEREHYKPTTLYIDDVQLNVCSFEE